MKGPYADPVMEEGVWNPGDAQGEHPPGRAGAFWRDARSDVSDFRGAGLLAAKTAARSLPRRVWAGARGCPPLPAKPALQG